MKLATLNINTSKTIAAVKSLIPPVLYHVAYRALIVNDIPDKASYAALFTLARTSFWARPAPPPHGFYPHS